jgi:hypothetical protein
MNLFFWGYLCDLKKHQEVCETFVFFWFNLGDIFLFEINP